MGKTAVKLYETKILKFDKSKSKDTKKNIKNYLKWVLMYYEVLVVKKWRNDT